MKISDYLKSHNCFKHLYLQHSEFLDKLITQQEVLESIKQLKGNTAPGNKGFPTEFYTVFSSVLSEPLTKKY